VPSSDPLAVADALARRFATRRLYVADLDAITHDQPQWDLIGRLADEGYSLTVDAGVRSADRLRRLADLGVTRGVVALETVGSVADFQMLFDGELPRPVVFSLDLEQGRPKTGSPTWPIDPAGIADIVAATVDALLILDLHSVGMTGGLSTLALCREIAARSPSLQLLTGGGVRGLHDLDSALAAGVREVLVASALHDGGLDELAIAS
jgi:phosphoribosylformimino-5-aminoimidazole carboxamide ribotide isomerase